MGKTSTISKDKYNEKSYARYTFRVRRESDLNEAIKDFTSQKGTSFNYLITKVLNDYFNLDQNNTRA